MTEGVDGLLRDKTRPSRIPPLGPEVAERVVARTLADPPGETTHWTADMMAKAAGIATPRTHFAGKVIRVTGTLSLFQGRPQIIVSDAANARPARIGGIASRWIGVGASNPRAATPRRRSG